MMQGLRLKFSSDRRNEWRCCFCCHVRTGTIFLGIWHLILNLLLLSAMALMRHPELFDQDPALPTPLSEVDNEHMFDEYSTSDLKITLGDGTWTDAAGLKPPHSQQSFKDRWIGGQFNRTEDMNVGILVTFCQFTITLLLLFGAIKGKPSYLMPFFCLQVFEFCINCWAAISYLCYPPNLNLLMSQNNNMALKEEFLRLSPQAFSLFIGLSFILGLCIKAYFIGVVWSCYKYLALRQVAAQRTVQFIDPDFQNLLPDLPDYETATKKYPTPPPSYDNAMRAQFPVVVDVNRYGGGPVAPEAAAAISVPAPALAATSPQHV